MEQMKTKINRIENKVVGVLLVISYIHQKSELHGRGNLLFLVLDSLGSLEKSQIWA